MVEGARVRREPVQAGWRPTAHTGSSGGLQESGAAADERCVCPPPLVRPCATGSSGSGSKRGSWPVRPVLVLICGGFLAYRAVAAIADAYRWTGEAEATAIAQGFARSLSPRDLDERRADHAPARCG